MNTIRTFWLEARKTVAAVVTGLIGWATVVTTSADAGVTDGEWIFLATALATALGVYTVTNYDATDA